MPQWASRHPGSSTSNSKQQRDTSLQTGLISPSTASPTPPSLPPIDYGIPTLHHPNERAESATVRHTRSFSHPFPSLFGSGKRSDKKHTQKANASSNVDSTDDESSFLGQSGKVRRDNSLSEQEAVTGQCMTCSSTVRWPRGVKVYRCLTCQTINDLEPVLMEGDPQSRNIAGEGPGPRRRTTCNCIS